MNFATETKPFVMKRAATMRSVKELPLSFANDGWAGYDGVPHNVPASAKPLRARGSPGRSFGSEAQPSRQSLQKRHLQPLWCAQ